MTGPSLSLRLHHGTVLNAVTTPTQIPVSTPIYFSAIVLACVLKHPSFSECEWRLITDELADSDPQIGVRRGKTMPLPYFRFPLVNGETQC